MIQVTPTISIEEDELKEEFTLASGPGGQNVNKVSTAVRLRFRVDSPSIPDAVRKRLISTARGRITDAGELVIEARRFRTQGANRRRTQSAGLPNPPGGRTAQDSPQDQADAGIERAQIKGQASSR